MCTVLDGAIHHGYYSRGALISLRVRYPRLLFDMPLQYGMCHVASSVAGDGRGLEWHGSIL